MWCSNLMCAMFRSSSRGTDTSHAWIPRSGNFRLLRASVQYSSAVRLFTSWMMSLGSSQVVVVVSVALHSGSHVWNRDLIIVGA